MGQKRVSSWAVDRSASKYFPAELEPEIRERARAIISRLQAKGATVVPVSLPSTSYGLRQRRGGWCSVMRAVAAL